MFIFLFLNLILITKLFTSTEKGKGGKGLKNNCENYLFEDYQSKVSILTLSPHPT
jgi:hypothetical protein